MTDSDDRPDHGEERPDDGDDELDALEDLEDGAGCTEVWERLAEERSEDDH
ncbi:hypothetical protein [Halobiforma nitratireducens]|uniref:hypothetical protein n=1 Tax=Halobiforma nitratireducens TaxID=130048 RepID=UPI0014612F82|nr:hypothetical protein [Halobiforma nitratireducens]